MWFRFPKGASSIAIQQQEFKTEVTDAEGFGYFRAPPHFAPTILSLAGFISAGELPPDAPPDLSPDDPKKDQAIAEMAASLDAKTMEIQGLREDLNKAQGQIQVLMGEAAKAVGTIDQLNDEVLDLKEKLAEAVEKAPPAILADDPPPADASLPLGISAAPAPKGKAA